MNQQELQKLKNSLPSDNNYYEWTEEQKELKIELNCIEMINSCLLYRSNFMTSCYKDEYIEKLGLKKVQELYDEQFSYVKNCIR